MRSLKSAARTAAVVMVALMFVASMTAAPVAAENNELNYDEGPNLVITEDSVTVAEHDRGEMASPLEYFGDDGEVQTLPATINHSASENPITVDFSKIEDDDLDTFPRKGDEEDDLDTDEFENWASAMDSSEWTKDAGNSAGSGTISSVSSPVPGVEFSTSSQTAGDTMVFTYSNFTIDSDVDKRVIFVPFEVASADSGATVELAAVESDGDEKAIELYNASGDSSTTADVATETGSGFVGQVKLSDLDIAGSGDGSLAAIDEIEVRVHDEDADVRLGGLDLEKKSKRTLGTEYNVTAEEEETFYQVESPGAHNLTGVSALGSWTEDAVIHDLTVKNLRYEAQYAPSDDVSVEYTEASDYQYPSKVEIYEAVEVPAAIDLSHSGLQLEATQEFVEPRYIATEYSEEPGDVDWENASYSDLSATYSESGETHVLDDTVTVGTEYWGHWIILLNDDEVKDLQETDAGAIGGPVSESDSFLGSIGSWIAGAIGSLLGALGIKSRWG